MEGPLYTSIRWRATLLKWYENEMKMKWNTLLYGSKNYTD